MDKPPLDWSVILTPSAYLLRCSLSCIALPFPPVSGSLFYAISTLLNCVTSCYSMITDDSNKPEHLLLSRFFFMKKDKGIWQTKSSFIQFAGPKKSHVFTSVVLHSWADLISSCAQQHSPFLKDTFRKKHIKLLTMTECKNKYNIENYLKKTWWHASNNHLYALYTQWNSQFW